MTRERESVEQLRAAIVADTDELATLKDRRDALRSQAAEVGRKFRTVEARRVRRIKRARDAGATTEQLAADARVTQQRIRQIAPGGRVGRPPKAKGPGAAVVDELLVDEQPAANPFARTAEQRARVEQLAAEPYPPTPTIEPGQLSGIARAVHELTSVTSSANLPVVDEQDDDDQDDEPEPEPARPVRARPLPDLRGPLVISRRVEQALVVHQGDVKVATAALVAGAIPDAMKILDQCRADARYDYTAHPSVPTPLQRPGRKQADMIWEGRPRFTNPRTPAGTPVDILDMNGAYLSALTRTHLPIGKLVQDPAGTPFDRRRTGIYLIEPIAWKHESMPNPLGDGREEKGPVWISGATMRLLMRASSPQLGELCRPPVILQSWTSGASENLLTKFGRQLAEARRQALADDDSVTVEYVKALYSKFVSTAGDSRANAALFRPEWVHEIRSQAYANLWYKAQKAAKAGMLIHRMMGTDELHLSGNWRWLRVDATGKLALPVGRDLSEVKVKGSYVVGETDA